MGMLTIKNRFIALLILAVCAVGAHAQTIVGGYDTNGNFAPIRLDLLGNLQSETNAINPLYLTGAAAQTAAVNNILTNPSGTAATDVTGFSSATIQVNSTGTSGTYIFEGSNDNVNFVSLITYNSGAFTAYFNAAIVAGNTNIVYTFPITTRYVRLRIASTINNTGIQAFAMFQPISWSPPTYTVFQGIGANLQVGGAGSVGQVPAGNPVAIGGVAGNAIPASALTSGRLSIIPLTTDNQVIVHSDGSFENEITVTTGATPLASASATALFASQGSGIRSYVTGMQFFNSSATGGTATILDNATAIWTGYLPGTGTSLQETPVIVEFHTPLKGTAATIMNIQLSSASMSVYYNIQGFKGN